jgi:hypothetical protein
VGAPPAGTLQLLALVLLIFAAAPAAAQIGINGTRQAAGTRDVEIVINPVSRCSRGDPRAVAAAAGSEARAVERERIAMDYRRLRYASGGLTDAEAAALAARERRLEAEAGRAYHYSSYESYERRRYAAGAPRYRHNC